MKESFKTGDLLRFENHPSQSPMANRLSKTRNPMVCMGTLDSLHGDCLVRIMFPNGQIAVYYASNLRKL